jgi:integrase
MLASGGYPWPIIPVERRDDYMAALESASVRQDIRPFAEFIGGLVVSSLRRAAVPPVPGAHRLRDFLTGRRSAIVAVVGAAGVSCVCGQRRHVFRTSAQVHLAMRGAPITAIQELAGHRELRMTQRYMHLTPAVLDSAIRLLDQAPCGAFRGVILETGTTSEEGPMNERDD